MQKRCGTSESIALDLFFIFFSFYFNALFALFLTISRRVVGGGGGEWKIFGLSPGQSLANDPIISFGRLFVSRFAKLEKLVALTQALFFSLLAGMVPDCRFVSRKKRPGMQEQVPRCHS